MQLLQRGHDVILDCSNINQEERLKWRNRIKAAFGETVLIHWHYKKCSKWTCLERLRRRNAKRKPDDTSTFHVTEETFELITNYFREPNINEPAMNGAVLFEVNCDPIYDI